MSQGFRLARIAVATVLCAASPLSLAAGACDQSDPCAARSCRIDTAMAQAKANGDTKGLAKLEKAKAEMSRCSVDGLKEKRRMALEQAQKRLDKRQEEFNRATLTYDPGKIKRAQRALDDARKAYVDLETSPL
jgi:hypothetical protein